MRNLSVNLAVAVIVILLVFQGSGLCGGFEEPNPSDDQTNNDQTEQQPINSQTFDNILSKKFDGASHSDPKPARNKKTTLDRMKTQLGQMIKKAEANMDSLDKSGHDPSKVDIKKASKYSYDQNDTIYVMPERRKFVDLSKTEFNRFHCEGNRKLTGKVFSEDKGITVERRGSNAFLRIHPEGYAFSSPFDLFLICGDGNESSVYRMVGNPVPGFSKNIILKDDGMKVQEALSFFKGKFRDNAIVELVKKAYEQDWEPYWIVKPRFKKIVDKPEYLITWYRTVDTNTEWVIEQYIVEARAAEVKISELAFINRHTAGVSVFDPVIENGKLGQVVVIREKAEQL